MLLIRMLHVLAAAIWVGGTVALVFVAVPVVRRLDGRERALALRQLGRRWRLLGWGALSVLVVTGIASAGEHTRFRPHALVHGGFGIVLLVKALLVGALVVAAAAHDFVLGPRLARQVRAGEPQSARRPLTRVGWTALALTIAVPVLGVVLAELAEH
ncbi:MAG TPA: DUF4149 domain-containing protein [Gaiellaceae bacterium]|nr:DUF4149 domain-containing protein [Gaiellaceae bacterium]